MEEYDTWKVKIIDDYTVEAIKGNNPPVRGEWDLLYGSSLLFNLDNNLRFIIGLQYKVLDDLENGYSGGSAYDAMEAAFSRLTWKSYSRF